MQIPFTEFEINKPLEKGKFVNSSKTQTLYYDTKNKGLGLRVSAKSKVYFFENRVNGKTMRLTIGDINHWSLNKAIQKARQMQIEIDNGRNPKIVKREISDEDNKKILKLKVANANFGDLWQMYIEYKQTNQNPKTARYGISDLHLRDLNNVIKDGAPLHEFKALPLSFINKSNIELWLKRESAKRPTRTALAYRLLKSFVFWLSETEYQGIIPKELFQSASMKIHVPSAKSKKDDCLQKSQLAEWFNSVNKISNQIIRAYLQCVLLTGSRRSEMLSLKWENIDFRWKTLTIRDKVDVSGQRTIPLTPYVASLIASLPKINDYVFSSKLNTSGILNEPTKAHKQALSLAGLPHITLHGLRRTFDTLSEWVEIPNGIIMQITGHKPNSVTEKHYKQRPIDLLRLWHEKYEAFLLEQAGIEQPKAEIQILKKVS